jgi:hypothetical protein
MDGTQLSSQKAGSKNKCALLPMYVTSKRRPIKRCFKIILGGIEGNK